MRRRLSGEKRGSFALRGSNWFPRPDAGDDAAWAADVRLLVDEHRKLRAVVAALKDRDLDKAAAGHRTTVRVLVRGIAAHDLYHAGQIQLLKRLAAELGGRYPSSSRRRSIGQRLHRDPVAGHRLRAQDRVVHRLLRGLQDGLEQRRHGVRGQHRPRARARSRRGACAISGEVENAIA